MTLKYTTLSAAVQTPANAALAKWLKKAGEGHAVEIVGRVAARGWFVAGVDAADLGKLAAAVAQALDGVDTSAEALKTGTSVGSYVGKLATKALVASELLAAGVDPCDVYADAVACVNGDVWAQPAAAPAPAAAAFVNAKKGKGKAAKAPVDPTPTQTPAAPAGDVPAPLVDESNPFGQVIGEAPDAFGNVVAVTRLDAASTAIRNAVAKFIKGAAPAVYAEYRSTKDGGDGSLQARKAAYAVLFAAFPQYVAAPGAQPIVGAVAEVLAAVAPDVFAEYQKLLLTAPLPQAVAPLFAAFLDRTYRIAGF